MVARRHTTCRTVSSCRPFFRAACSRTLTDLELVWTSSGDRLQVDHHDRPNQHQILGGGCVSDVRSHPFCYQFTAFWQEARGGRAIAYRSRARAKKGGGITRAATRFPDLSRLLAARNYGVF